MNSRGSKLEQLLSLAAQSEDEIYIQELHRLILRGMWVDEKEAVITEALKYCVGEFPGARVSKYERALDAMPKNGPDPKVEEQLVEELAQ